jgi:hypothetical protein
MEELMRTKRWKYLGAAAGLLFLAVPVFAHHGNAAYDTTKIVTVQATVSDLQFVNPHVQVVFEVTDETGKVAKWLGELTSPNHLARSGWNRHTLKPGDQVTFSGLRAKSGATTLWITRIVGADGHEIPLAPAD